MPKSEIQEFATLLIEKVRDVSIKSCDQALNPNSKDPVAERWRKAAEAQKGLKGIASVMIPDVVDDVIFNLLDAIDNGHLKLTFTTSNGKQIDLQKDGLGELAGWYMGSGGWRAMYSRERSTDDFSDLQ
jgi:hypothetical protein